MTAKNSHVAPRSALDLDLLTLAAMLSELECVDAAAAGHVEPIPRDDERLEMA